MSKIYQDEDDDMKVFNMGSGGEDDEDDADVDGEKALTSNKRTSKEGDKRSTSVKKGNKNSTVSTSKIARLVSLLARFIASLTILNIEIYHRIVRTFCDKRNTFKLYHSELHQERQGLPPH